KSPANPLGDSIDYAIIYGSSQSGRWIRTFLQLGFNEGVDHERVFEGAIPHKASNRGAFNVRFAQPPGSQGPSTRKSNFLVRNPRRPGTIRSTRLRESPPVSSIAVARRILARRSPLQ